MTPEQKERIRAAARELGAALNEANKRFDVRIGEMEMKPMGCAQPDYIYSVSVTLMAEEVIA